VGAHLIARYGGCGREASAVAAFLLLGPALNDARTASELTASCRKI